MSPEELRQLQMSVGQFISFNSFLSTSQQEDVAQMFAGDSVLFRIVTNVSNEPSNTSVDVSWWNRPLFERSTSKPVWKPYAPIVDKSQFADEEEVLFMAGTIFCLDRMESPDAGKKSCWTAHLHLAGESDHQLTELYRYRVIELSAETTLAGDLNPLLNEMGYLTTGDVEENDDQLEKSYSDLSVFLLKAGIKVYQTTNGQIRLGRAQTKQGDYQAAIDTFMKAQTGTTDLQRIAEIESNLALVYEKMKDYPMALSYCRRAEQHSNSVDNYRIMVRLYMKRKDYVPALQIAQSRVLPQEKDSLEIARVYRLVGNIYEAMQQSELALDNYKNAFKLLKELYPFDHVNDVFHHKSRAGSEMKDICRHLLRLIDKTQKNEEYAVLDQYFLEFNNEREEAARLHSFNMFHRDGH